MYAPGACLAASPGVSLLLPQNCGLVVEAHIIDERSEWRTFGDKVCAVLLACLCSAMSWHKHMRTSQPGAMLAPWYQHQHRLHNFAMELELSCNTSHAHAHLLVHLHSSCSMLIMWRQCWDTTHPPYRASSLAWLAMHLVLVLGAHPPPEHA